MCANRPNPYTLPDQAHGPLGEVQGGLNGLAGGSGGAYTQRPTNQVSFVVRTKVVAYPCRMATTLSAVVPSSRSETEKESDKLVVVVVDGLPMPPDRSAAYLVEN